MIQRINLIEKQALSFTYERLLQICFVILIFNGLIFGYQYFLLKWVAPELENKEAELSQLKTDKQNLMARPIQKRVDVGEFQALLDKMDSVPLWSKLIYELSDQLPNSIWISHFKNFLPQQDAPKSKTDSKDEKAQEEVLKPKKIDKLGVEINGIGSEVKNIAEFLTRLEKSPFFSDLKLTESQQKDFGYEFTIQGNVVLEYAR